MIIKISMITILELLLFLFSVSIFNLGGYVLAVVIILSIVLFGSIFFQLDSKALWLLLFSTSYFIFFTINHGMDMKNILYYLLYPWMSYLIGFSFMQKTKNKQLFSRLVFILTFGLFLHGCLNTLEFLRTYGFDFVLNTAHRISVDFWRKENIAVTACALYFVMALAWGIGYLFFGENKKMRSIALITVIISIAANVMYKNRAAIVIAAIIVMICVLFTAQTPKRRLVIFSEITIAVLLMVLIWVNDVFGIRTLVLDIGIIERFTGNEIGRVDLWIDFLRRDWWAYPFGGMKRGAFFALNLWLDILLDTGYIPTIAFTAFTFSSFGTLREFYYKNREFSLPYIMLLFGGVLGCAIEPVLSANPYVLYIIIIVLGAIEGMNRNNIMLKEFV